MHPGVGVHVGAGGHSRQSESRSSGTAAADSFSSSLKFICSSQKNALRPLRATKTTAPIIAPAPTDPTASESRSAATHSHCDGISASNVQRGAEVVVRSSRANVAEEAVRLSGSPACMGTFTLDASAASIDAATEMLQSARTRA